MAKYFEVGLTVTLFRVTVSLSTPDFTNTNPKHIPSWLPKWEFLDYTGQPVEYRKMFMLTWFFHLCAAWSYNDSDQQL
jgi:hypothetical protein